MRKVLSMITSGAENYTLDIIKDSWDHFDKIIVVEGNLTEMVKKARFNIYFEIASRLSKHPLPICTEKTIACIIRNGEEIYYQVYNYGKLSIVDRPWNDNYAEAYQAHLNLLEEGDWVLIVDSDEFPGELLKLNLDKIIEDSNNGENFDIVHLPVVDYLDDVALWGENEVPQTYKNGMWTKQILLRKGKEPIQLKYFGSHVIPIGTKYAYYPYPYLHKKKWTDFFHNEVFQMVLCPEGQMVNPFDAINFKKGLEFANIKTMADMRNAIKNGTLGDYLENLITKNRHRYRNEHKKELHPFRQLYCLYYLYTDNGKNSPENDVTLEDIKNDIYFWKKNFGTYQ